MSAFSRTLVIIILGCSFAVTAFPQNFHGGILLGLTASQVDGDSFKGFNKVGIHGGAFVYKMFGDIVGAHLEIKYTGRGAMKSISHDNPETYKLNLNYIDLPLALNIIFMERYLLEAGVVPGYMFAAGGKDREGTISKDQLVDFHKFDLGTLLGFRLKVTEVFSIGVRHSYSLISIQDSEIPDAYYGWFGGIFGFMHGDFNNYLSFGLYYEIR